jgi:hypothetical protein
MKLNKDRSFIRLVDGKKQEVAQSKFLYVPYTLHI